MTEGVGSLPFSEPERVASRVFALWLDAVARIPGVGSLTFDRVDYFYGRHMRDNGFVTMPSGISRDSVTAISLLQTAGIRPIDNEIRVGSKRFSIFLAPDILEWGGYALDIEGKALTMPSQRTVQLSRTESRLAATLLSFQGRVAQFSAIAANTWPNYIEMGSEPSNEQIRTYIKYLRDKIGDHERPEKERHIEGVMRLGYKWRFIPADSAHIQVGEDGYAGRNIEDPDEYFIQFNPKVRQAYGTLRLDPDGRTIYTPDGYQFRLTPKEAVVFSAVLNSVGDELNLASIINQVWPERRYPHIAHYEEPLKRYIAMIHKRIVRGSFRKEEVLALPAPFVDQALPAAV